MPNSAKTNSRSLTYAQRAEETTQQVAKQLFQIMEAKKSNLCVAADVTSKEELLSLVHKVGPHVCILKTHMDIIEDFDQDLIKELEKLAKDYNFLIFEDRKFADIGNTGMLQYRGGIQKIADWAHIVNAHTISGPDIVTSLKKGKGERQDRALLLLAEMSSKGNLFTPEYTQKTIDCGLANKDFVMGFISMGGITNDPDMLCMTPGIQFNNKADGKGQQYVEPEDAINRGSDVIIVGRGIYEADDPAQAALQYKEAGWQAYVLRIENSAKATEDAPAPVENDDFDEILSSVSSLIFTAGAKVKAAAESYVDMDNIGNMMQSFSERFKA